MSNAHQEQEVNKSIPLFPFSPYIFKILNLLLPVTFLVGVGEMWGQPASQATQDLSLKPFFPKCVLLSFSQ